MHSMACCRVILMALSLIIATTNVQARSLHIVDLVDGTDAPATEPADISTLAYTVDLPETASISADAMENAIPRPLPTLPFSPELLPNVTNNEIQTCEGSECRGIVSGSAGSAEASPPIAFTPDNSTKSSNATDVPAPEQNGDLSTAAYGTGGYPYSTAGAYSYSSSSPTNLYPWRAAGKLYVTFPEATYICSASLIRPGLVVTAAHCISKFGDKNSLASAATFYPAFWDNTAPYGGWSVRSITVPPSYLGGTDPCSVRGIVCENDLALLTLNYNSGDVPGTKTGYFGYGWGNYGFTGSGTAQITQLGYPGALDNSQRMIRNDGPAFSQPGNQMQIGTALTAGSSGGPWLNNFGTSYSAASGFYRGADSGANYVMGTTSWGYVGESDFKIKVQGASRFSTNTIYTTSPNIVVLVNAACNALSSSDRTKICGL